MNPGIYTINVSTEDGCAYTGDIEINNPDELLATVALTKPLTCTDGEITVYPVGGTSPYSYFVNSTTVFQGTPIINVPTAGVYNITVVDFNNCSVDVSITVDAIPAPDFNITKSDILCSDEGDVGTININVTNPNGNTLVTFQSPSMSDINCAYGNAFVRINVGMGVTFNNGDDTDSLVFKIMQNQSNVLSKFTYSLGGPCVNVDQT